MTSARDRTPERTRTAARAASLAVPAPPPGRPSATLVSVGRSCQHDTLRRDRTGPTRSLFRLTADRRVRMRLAEECFQCSQLLFLCHQSLSLLRNLFLLSFDLSLLLADSVHEHGRQLVVLHAFDLALVVAEREQGFDALDIFRGKADILHPALFPGERDRPQPFHDVETAGE